MSLFRDIALPAVLAFASISFASADDSLQADLLFTYGESGQPCPNVFYTGETLFVSLRLTGLKDSRPYTGQIQIDGIVVDSNNQQILKTQGKPNYYTQVLGGDSLETTLEIDSDRKGIPPGNYTLVVTITHLSSGRVIEARKPFIWKEPKSFCNAEPSWFLDVNHEFPSGPTLQPGRFYALGTRVMNMSFDDRTFRVRSRIDLYRFDSKTLLGGTAEVTLTTTVPEQERLPERFWDTTLLQFNKVGRFSISQESVDQPTGKTTSMKLPVDISGTGQDSKSDNIEPFMFLTHGKYGVARTTDFLMGEDIWATLGFADPNHGGRTTQASHVYFLDGHGRVVTEFSLGESKVLAGFGDRFFLGYLQFGVNPDRGLVEPVREIQLHLTEKEKGTKTILSAPIRFMPIEGLSAINLRVSRDSHDKVAAGQFLTAGQLYYLNCDITKYTVKDYAIDITHSVKAFTEDGQPIAGTELVLDHKRALSVAEKLNAQLPLTMQISLNRPGKFLLRSTFTDNLSGQTYTSDMPVEVVSPFQFVKEEATIEN
ncbi:hypothetical protein DTL42_25890 [Bremerella cremea]|uniref:Uncharacterized protein n=1 Tax=Bremerella cremea TaxID=1031537 RepID=A0A368KJP7_9BACT|nr:hypothetical protein [Bremerella cremea]RCS40792.1 hypothetical protein DTL42_25890 [Bremerella cremea]